MNHNFRLHQGITTHLEKIYGAPSSESWCDIKTKVMSWGGGGAGINYILSSVHAESQVYQLKEDRDQGYDL